MKSKTDRTYFVVDCFNTATAEHYVAVTFSPDSPCGPWKTDEARSTISRTIIGKDLLHQDAINTKTRQISHLLDRRETVINKNGERIEKKKHYILIPSADWYEMQALLKRIDTRLAGSQD
jgi:hypothetical protein